MLLFLIGLLTGFAVMEFRNPRMGLAAHLEGVLNGMFLVLGGLVWNDLVLSDGWKKIVWWTLVYGTFANWFFSTLSAIWGTSRTTPLSGAGYEGTALHELVATAGLVSVGITMVLAASGFVYGLRGKGVS